VPRLSDAQDLTQSRSIVVGRLNGDVLLPLATIFPGLDRRARNRPVGAEDAAVAGLRLETLPAAFAVVKELTGVSRHGFSRGVGARRTGQHGNQFYHRATSAWLRLGEGPIRTPTIEMASHVGLRVA
jgi:hypothetical protein